jgi:hypothetical protein
MSIDWKRYILDSDISDASKKMYVSQLTLLLDETKQPIEWILSHPKDVLAMMDQGEFSDGMKKNRISSVCSLFKHWEEAAREFSNERTAWAEAQKTLNKQNIERTLTGDPSEREIVNWVPWRKVLDAESMLRKTECGSWRHLLLSMYTHIEPMRGDFGNVRLYTTEPPSCETSAGNYMYLSPTAGQSRICLNEYKTSKKYGQFSRSIPESLVFIIRASLRAEPRKYLFVNTNGQPYDKKNSFVKFANRMLYSIFHKHMSISLLRHSFITAIDFNKSNAGDLHQVSRNMQHSMEMQQYYRRNVPELNVSLEDTPARAQQPIPLRDREDREDREARRERRERRRKRRESRRSYINEDGAKIYYV